MFDSRQYEFADVVVMIGMRDVTGITAIEYVAKQEKKPYYGKGSKPLCIQRGKKEYNGHITLAQSELEALTVGGIDLLDLEFSIVVTYGNPTEGDLMVVDELLGVQFTETPKSLDNDKKTVMDIKLPFKCLDIRKRA